MDTPIVTRSVSDGQRCVASAMQFRTLFRSHTGRWEPLPVVGRLEDIVRAITEELGAYIDPANL